MATENPSPETAAPETATPETTTSETKAPENDAPQNNAPQSNASESNAADSNASERKGDDGGKGGGRPALDRDDDEQDFVDQSKIDFDPDEGLYSGTAVEGRSEIAGPHIDPDSGELTGMDEAEQPSSEDEAARQHAPSAGDDKPGAAAQ